MSPCCPRCYHGLEEGNCDRCGYDLPCIVVSGVVGEEIDLAALRQALEDLGPPEPLIPEDPEE